MAFPILLALFFLKNKMNFNCSDGDLLMGNLEIESRLLHINRVWLLAYALMQETGYASRQSLLFYHFCVLPNGFFPAERFGSKDSKTVLCVCVCCQFGTFTNGRTFEGRTRPTFGVSASFRLMWEFLLTTLTLLPHSSPFEIWIWVQRILYSTCFACCCRHHRRRHRPLCDARLDWSIWSESKKKPPWSMERQNRQTNGQPKLIIEAATSNDVQCAFIFRYRCVRYRSVTIKGYTIFCTTSFPLFSLDFRRHNGTTQNSSQ